jgi:PKD repeat protein
LANNLPNINIPNAVSKPVINFTANKTEGDKPLIVRFTDTSTNSPTAWSWDFGDGNSSIEQNPVYTYSANGSYTVALSAANIAGSNTLSRSNYITVIAPVIENNTFSSVTSGISTVITGSHQNVTIDTTTANVTTSGNTVTLNTTGSSWSSVTINLKEPVNTGSSTIKGTVASVTAMTDPVTASAGSAGTPSVQIQLNMSEVPQSTASITQTITKDPSATAQSAFTVAAIGTNKQIDSIAYTLNVAKTNLANAGDGGSNAIIRSATLTMTVSSAWVTEHGGASKIVVMRMADDGSTEILSPTITGPTSGEYTLIIYSPNGLSTFAVAAVSSSSSGGSSGGLGSSSGSSQQSRSSKSGSMGTSDLGYTGPQPTVRGYGTQQAPVVTKQPASSAKQSTSLFTPIPTVAVQKPATFPIMPVVFGAAAIVVVGAGFLVRRWWIRRQNPALFRKYE